MQNNNKLTTGTERPFIFGEGRVSGYLSACLGICALLAVLAFKFPSFLTTADMRGILYTENFARSMLLLALIVSFSMGMISYVLNRNKSLALVGIATSFMAVLLGGANTKMGMIDAKTTSFGLDWLLLDLIFSMLILIPLEKMFAQNKQQILRPEWRTDMVYFIIAHLAIQFILLFTNSVHTELFSWASTADLHAFIQSFPWWLQLIGALFIADLFQYIGHRAYHKISFLWGFHAVHHSSKTMDWLAGSRNHFFDVIATRTIIIVPLYILGFSEMVMNIYIIWVSIQALLIHANVNWNFGFLKHILVTPQFHHWHHSDDPAYVDKNYAIHFTLLDRLFGSYKMPDEWPQGYGILADDMPQGVVKQFFYPFQR